MTRLMLAATLLVPGALAIGSSAACANGSQRAAIPVPGMVGSNDSRGANKADIKKVILNVFGMT